MSQRPTSNSVRALDSSPVFHCEQVEKDGEKLEQEVKQLKMR
jgi:hypothetical protein